MKIKLILELYELPAIYGKVYRSAAEDLLVQLGPDDPIDPEVLNEEVVESLRITLDDLVRREKHPRYLLDLEPHLEQLRAVLGPIQQFHEQRPDVVYEGVEHVTPHAIHFVFNAGEAPHGYQ